ncbi:MAG TPA: DnaJ domain-containing protein [Ktedonobacteraceae bacterium]|nr:DnaJ domain-containing protein [Ktedonobacteraceae bacterium]
MDTPENYYAILGVPIDADSDTLKRAYRQLARRYHPDLAGPEGALDMKRINRAYDVLSDPEKRRSYDTVIGGVIDLRKKGFTRPRSHAFHPSEHTEFSGLNIFSTRGPFQVGPSIHSTLGVISALHTAKTVNGILIAAGSLDGKGAIWQVINGKPTMTTSVASDPDLTVESLRELRFSDAGSILAGWGRLNLHIWDAYTGSLLWSYNLIQRAVSAHYSLDMTLQVMPDGKRVASMALPYFTEDPRSPSAWGVRGTDVVNHEIGAAPDSLVDPLSCIEEGMENRRFWAIRMRALSQDKQMLVTLSCAQVPHEQQQMAIVRTWNLTAKTRFGSQTRPQVASSIIVGHCQDCTPPYTITPDATKIAFVYKGDTVRLCDTVTGVYSEYASGTMGGTAKLAISPDGQWLAVAREDSEVNEGVIDLWSVNTNQVVQKFYHPWQISALHFADKQLAVALTDGTFHLWE